jgi:hypothetical protein
MLPPKYSEMSEKQTVGHWASKMHTTMRWAGESGHEEIEALDRSVIEQSRADDPAVDDLMPKILAVVAWAWADDKDEFLRRVNEQMGTSFEYDMDYLYPSGKPSAKKATHPFHKLWRRFIGRGA